MQYTRPIVLSIAGFDPTGGAGGLADVKTFERNGCLGMAILSALTIQTEDECLAVEWRCYEEIRAPLKSLLDYYPVQSIKIGLIENISTLVQLCRFIKSYKDIPIVWDTIIAASSGYTFLKNWRTVDLLEVYSLLSLITPNVKELKALTEICDEMEAAETIASYCPVLVKGGHREQHRGDDVLFIEREKRVITSGVDVYMDKHGTGCILSSAITAYLAQGIPLYNACRRAKRYVERVANSNQNRLAYHDDV